MMENQTDKKNTLSVTVAIPAFNEENNIAHLLNSILWQKGSGFLIERIVVMTDGCTDGTAQKVNEMSKRYPFIELAQRKERKGKAQRLNELYRMNSSDILVTFDADIVLARDNVIERAILRLGDEKAVVVGGNGIPMPGETFAEKIIAASNQLWYEARKNYKDGNNIYNCGGSFFAMKKPFVDRLKFPSETIAEQEFIYLAAQKYGGKFVFAKDAKYYYRAPNNFKDYFIQIRHLKNIPDVSEMYFGDQAYSQRYLPPGYKIAAVIRTVGKYHIYGILALFLQIVSKVMPMNEDENTNGIWATSLSTKTLFDAGKKGKFHIVFLDFDDVKNPLLGGGQARVTLEVGRRLAEKGHRITVITSKYPGYVDRRENGLRYKHIGFGTKNVRLNNIFYIPAVMLASRKIKADVIVECFTAPMSTLFTPLFTKIPVVALSTSFEAEKFSKQYHLPFWRVERLGLKFYKHFIAYSEYYEGKARKMNSKIHSKVIHLGVQDSLFGIPRRKARHILYLGRLDIGQKGVDILLRAYARIKDKIKYPLIIAGSGPDEPKVRSLVKDLDLGDKVRMAGLVHGREKENLLAEALCVAVPSRNETFCLSVLESLAAGMPVASFDIPGVSWAADDIVLKAKPYDEREYGQLILKIAAKNSAGEMEGACRQFAGGFKWDQVVDKFESFFKESMEMGEKGKSELENKSGDEKEKAQPAEVSVGICAYNEEKNIRIVLDGILSQKQENWKLREVIVYCDGCTDQTALLAWNVKSDRIKVIDGAIRRGKSYGINKICRQSKSEILVFFDADVKLVGNDVITRMVEVMRRNNAKLAGGNTQPFAPKTFFERAVYSTFLTFDSCRTNINGGRNLFTCNGGCLAIARELVEKINIPPEVRNDDTYIYLTCKMNNCNYAYSRDAVVNYRLPKNLDDYLRQVFRSNPEAAAIHMERYFGRLSITEYDRPKMLYLVGIAKAFAADPAPTAYMIFIMILCRPFYSVMSKKYKLEWWSAKSTK